MSTLMIASLQGRSMNDRLFEFVDEVDYFLFLLSF